MLSLAPNSNQPIRKWQLKISIYIPEKLGFFVCLFYTRIYFTTYIYVMFVLPTVSVSSCSFGKLKQTMVPTVQFYYLIILEVRRLTELNSRHQEGSTPPPEVLGESPFHTFSGSCPDALAHDPFPTFKVAMEGLSIIDLSGVSCLPRSCIRNFVNVSDTPR